jgi:GlpG protein
MRQVGDINGRARAERFLNFLAAQGIAAEAREDEDDGERMTIWVIDEDHLAAAEEHYVSFKVSPDAAVFDAAPAPKPKAEAKADAGRNRFIDVRSEVFGRNVLGMTSVTVILITASVLLTLLSGTPRGMELKRLLYYSEYLGMTWPEIRDGEVWRLVTPIFLHSGFIHLIFNMLWLYQLGGAIEQNEGKLYLLGFTFGFAALVDTAQYVVSGPAFVGFSGVTYSYLGYVWMMSRYQAGSRYYIARETVIMMVIWIAICYTGLLGPIANTQHVVGFLAGTAFGWLRSGYALTLIRRKRYKG